MSFNRQPSGFNRTDSLGKKNELDHPDYKERVRYR